MKFSLHLPPLGRRANACRPRLLLKAARKPPRWLALLLVLAAALAAPLQAQAQTAGTMLLLSSAESTSQGSIDVVNNTWNLFSAQARLNNLNPVNGTGLLSGTAPLSVPSDTRLLVVETVYNGTIATARMDELAAIMSSRPNLAIVIFSDGCCSSDANLGSLVKAINAIRPASWLTPIALGPIIPSTPYTAPLNTNSIYAPTFSTAGLNTIAGLNYTPVINVPLNYALYTQVALPAPPPDTVTQNIVGFFMPQAASNNGQGACIFLTGDATPLDVKYGSSSQLAAIAEAFTNAALDPDGACAQPVAGAPDLWSELTEPDGLVTNNPALMTLTVGNSPADGVVASTDGQVDITIPDNLQLVPNSLTFPAGSTCTTTTIPTTPTTTTTNISCTLPPLDPGAIVAFNFKVVAPVPIPPASAKDLTATVSGVTGEVNTGNNTATLEGVATSDGAPDLSVALALQNPLYIGVPNILTLTVSNSNELTATNSTTPGTATVTLPSGLKLIPGKALPAGCTANDTTNTIFTCVVKSLDKNETQSFDFPVYAPAPILADDMKVSAAVEVAGDVDTGNNTFDLHSLSTNNSPDVSATVTGPGTLPVGTPATMTLTVSNSGEPGVGMAPAGSAGTVTLPPGVELIPGSLPEDCTANATNTAFTCTVNNILNPGDDASFEFQVLAPAPIGRVQLETDVTWPSIGGAEATSLPILRDLYSRQPSPIPTLAELALALLALAVAASATAQLRRRG